MHISVLEKQDTGRALGCFGRQTQTRKSLSSLQPQMESCKMQHSAVNYLSCAQVSNIGSTGLGWARYIEGPAPVKGT